MSEPQVPQSSDKDEVNEVVDSANAALADAEAARATGADAAAVSDEPVGDATAPDPKAEAKASGVDADLAAFEEAERAFPGTFGGTFTPPPPAVETPASAPAAADAADDVAVAATAATVAYAATANTADVTETRIVAPEPVFVPPAQPQPIFVQAPEAPRERGNRGTIAGIGLLAALSFAVLLLGTALGLGALTGEVSFENIGTAVLATISGVEFWTTVVVFYLVFCILGAIINRGRWGHWVIWGLVVGLGAYGGYLLGALIAAPFWTLTASQGSALLAEHLFAPLALASFVFGRELTIWFGAWAARSGARKTVLNAEAQREYERTLEAGPQLP
ncbi:ABC transporter [Microbacterium keratanolyticum]|uniref:ABC transporter n=1 Tax=Microbacterium keratanolyticum TaxID=67574 RepID=UPI00363A967D